MLPWSAVDSSAFEPIGDVSNAAVTAAPVRLPALTLDSVPSVDQLDETELAAKLILNELHADTGEQIEIRRYAREVEVVGLVDTDERKHDLRAQLATVPGLKVSIQSVSDARSAPASVAEAISIESASLPDYPSALESYLRARGRSVDEINATSRAIFNGALAISRESKALAELGTRFNVREQRQVIISATVADLLYSHHERLDTALLLQRTLLARTEGVPVSVGSTAPQRQASLSDQAALNLALAKELTQTNSPPQRSAEAIVAEALATLDSLNAAAQEVYLVSLQNSAVSAKE